MRGNLSQSFPTPLIAGSIPAYAGEPFPKFSYTADSRVYPRVCGGTADILQICTIHCGLSPRMRGNPDDGLRSNLAAGSIPAYAGEP